MDIEVKKIKKISGSLEVPSDKSISHRAAMLGSLCSSPVLIKNYSIGEDCQNTLKIMEQLGVEIKKISPKEFYLHPQKLIKPAKELYAGNSGTTTRLLSGILAGQNFTSVITGDISLSQRPMKRIITPLTQMGAVIDANDNKLPLKITGGGLNGINYNSPIASAQVKSCILFAGLFAEGETTVTEPYKSRDHSERMLKYLGADVTENNNTVSIKKTELTGKTIEIANDISSAAFFMVAAAICPASKLLIKNVGINPTRAGIIEVMKNMHANIAIQNKRTICNEPVADILIEYSEELKGTTIEGEIIPRLIDELPIIAILATQAEGVTVVKNAEELKNKESDRIKLVCEMIKALGGDITPTDDGFIINGKTDLMGDCVINPNHDHRIAMSSYIGGLICKRQVLINEFEWVNTSFPEFLELINKVSEE